MKKILSDRIEYQNEAGKLHRLDGPAREWSDGSKEWYFNNLLHRLDGPAIKYSDGYKSWWVNGQRHRLDGPAVERSNGDKEWRIEDVQFSQQEFEEHPLVLQEKQRKQDLEIERIRNNKNKVSRWKNLGV